MGDTDQDEDDPLERIVVDRDQMDRERLASSIEGVVAVDRESGEPVTRSEYHDLDNKPRFVARLLARRAAFELGYTDESEIGRTSAELDAKMEASGSTIQNYGGESFVENDDEYGGYHVPGHSVGLAVEFLEDAREDES